MLDKIDKELEKHQKDYDVLCKAVPALAAAVSFKEFVTNLERVNGRAYNVVYTDNNTRQVLIPIVDMALVNAEGKQSNCTIVQRDSQLKLIATKKINRND